MRFGIKKVMGAPKGNKYAVGGGGGRPTKLTPKLLEKARGFLKWQKGQIITKVVFNKDGRQEIEAPRPPTVNHFSEYLGISRETAYAWDKENIDFSDILSEVQQKYEQVLIDNGLVDRYNANLAKFLLSADHGKKEKSDLTSNDKEIAMNIVNYVESNSHDSE
jgi:hypothetical protein